MAKFTWVDSISLLNVRMVFALLVVLFLVYIISLAIYRLYITALAKFPGPWLAALTLWYEFYHDVILRGRYTWKIREMHKTYGAPKSSCRPV